MQKRLTKKDYFFNNTHPLDSVGHLPPSCRIHQHRIAYPAIETGGHWVWLMPRIAGNLELLRVM